jgi:hypothetical protein
VVVPPLLRCRSQSLHYRLALSLFPSLPNALRYAIFLHVLAKLHRPAVAVTDCVCLTRLLVALDELPHRIERQLVLLRLACRVVAGRNILEINVLKVVIEQLADMRRNWLPVKSHRLNAARVDRAVPVFNHLLEHV